MTIDLAFTKDSDWKSEREALWEPRGKDLKDSFRKKEIESIKQYFMTGVVSPDYQLSDNAMFGYFPVQSAEGWDFVLSRHAKDKSAFLDAFMYSFQDRENVAFMAPYELAKWDYFLGDVFEPTITSRVPIGSEGELVAIELEPHDIFCRIISGIFGFLDRGSNGDNPKYIQRIEYFWSLWPYIVDESFTNTDRNSDQASTVYQVNRILKHVVKYKPKKKFDDPNKLRPEFLALLEKQLDSMYDQLCPKLQQLWDETKAERDVVTAKTAKQKAQRAEKAKAKKG